MLIKEKCYVKTKYAGSTIWHYVREVLSDEYIRVGGRESPILIRDVIEVRPPIHQGDIVRVRPDLSERDTVLSLDSRSDVKKWIGHDLEIITSPDGDGDARVRKVDGSSNSELWVNGAWVYNVENAINPPEPQSGLANTEKKFYYLIK